MQGGKNVLGIKSDFAAADLLTGLIHWESRACIIGEGGVFSPVFPLMLQPTPCRYCLGTGPCGKLPVPLSPSAG